MLNVGDTVKVIAKTLGSDGEKHEYLPISSIGKVKEVCTEDNGRPYCIQKFENQQLNTSMDVVTIIFVLAEKFQCYIDYPELLSFLRKPELIEYLDENGVFDSEREYEFFCNVIRKRKQLTERQQRWMNGIVYFKIKLFILDTAKAYT